MREKLILNVLYNLYEWGFHFESLKHGNLMHLWLGDGVEAC